MNSHGYYSDDDANLLGKPLTPRERDAFISAVKTGNNKAAAIGLRISRNTLNNYLTAVYRKLGVAGKTQAVVRALERGIVSLDEFPEL